MKEVTIKLCSIAEDGLPDTDKYIGKGRIAFIFDGSVISGWPLAELGYPSGVWEGDSDVSHGQFGGITHYFIFDRPMWEYEKG